MLIDNVNNKGYRDNAITIAHRWTNIQLSKDGGFINKLSAAITDIGNIAIYFNQTPNQYTKAKEFSGKISRQKNINNKCKIVVDACGDFDYKSTPRDEKS